MSRSSDRHRKAHRVAVVLHSIYGSPDHGNKQDPLDELVFILLSLMTTTPSFNRVYERLKAACPSWSALPAIPLRRIRALLKDGGLSNQKALHLRKSLRKIEDDFGRVTLNSLRRMTDEEAQHYLCSLPGIGTKAAKCVMMYALGRKVLPVDTHVWRISKRLGLVETTVPYSRIHEELERVVAPSDRYSFHVNMVAHGQQVCFSKQPRCAVCSLKRMCVFYRVHQAKALHR